MKESIIESPANSSARSRTSAQRRGRTNAVLASLTAVMLAHQITPADCFGGLKTTQQQRPATKTTTRSSALNFRTATNPEQEFMSTSTPTTANSYFSSLTNDIVGATRGNSDLPTWLATDQTHLSEQNMRKLADFMRESFFTENETLKLAKAIEEAASGDRNLAAGAADFCLLLAETMEMGLNALTAAAFHYCSCVRSRQRGVMDYDTTNMKHLGYGDHVVDIVTDAARLKKLEMVAGSVMETKHSARVSPDRRDAENLRHLLLTETKDWRALAIRSAACLYRLRGIRAANQQSDFLTPESIRASREALSIYAPLASRLGMHRLKNELEGAAFRILYRRQYQAVHSLHQRRGGKKNDDDDDDDENSSIGESMRQVLDLVKTDMTAILESDPEFQVQVEDFEVTARVKEPYSLWKKMLRLGYHHVLQVPDALAVRIVLEAKRLTPDEPPEVTRARERALCYYAQKICLDRWPKAADPRFKDYIDKPKTNGYQSLHYTAETWWQGEPWNFEVQVRSAEMHQVAEFGLASHWDYKAAQKSTNDIMQTVTLDTDDHSSDAYLRNVQQWHWMQRAGTNVDASPASFEPVWLSDIWQSRERADRIRARTERLQPYLTALKTAQSDLARDQVFVFLKTANSGGEGKVLSLPAGACVLDALREGERTLGLPLAHADPADLALNGHDTSVTRQLHNGDILDIPIASAAVAA